MKGKKRKRKGTGGVSMLKRKEIGGGEGWREGKGKIWIFCKCDAKAWTRYIMQIGYPRIRKGIFMTARCRYLLKFFCPPKIIFCLGRKCGNIWQGVGGRGRNNLRVFLRGRKINFHFLLLVGNIWRPPFLLLCPEVELLRLISLLYHHRGISWLPY